MEEGQVPCNGRANIYAYLFTVEHITRFRYLSSASPVRMQSRTGAGSLSWCKARLKARVHV